jgi:small subunit ribosomal protein S17
MSRRVLQGVVVSDAGDKTVIVRVERRVMHPVYKKFVTHSKKYAAHDAGNRWHIGDAVRIEESRPISKRKHWVVLGGAAEGGGEHRSSGGAGEASATDPGAAAAGPGLEAAETAAGAP